jgi:hypothetical protein
METNDASRKITHRIINWTEHEGKTFTEAGSTKAKKGGSH